MLRRLGIGLAALFLLVFATIAGLQLWLRTQAGGRWLATRAVQAIDGSLAGQLELGAVRWQGLATVVLEDVRLLAPDGTEVASLDSASFRLGLRPLLRREVVLHELRGEGLGAQVIVGRDGEIGFLQALGIIDDSGAPTDGPPWAVTLRDARVEVGSITVAREDTPDEPVAIDGGAVRFDVTVRDEVVAFAAESTLAVAAPVEGPALVTVLGQSHAGGTDLARFDVSLPRGLELEGSARGLASGENEGDPSRGEITFRTRLPARGLLPYGGPRLGDAMRATGRLSLGERMNVDVVASPDAGGELRADGWLRFDDQPDFAADLAFQGLDPSSLLPDLPPGRLDGKAKVAGLLSPPPDAGLRADVTLDRSMIQGVPVGPGSATVRLEGDRLTARELDLVVPGARLEGELAWSPGGRVQADGTVDASSLEALAAAARRFGVELPALKGAVSLDFSADLAPGQQDVRVRAESPRIDLGDRWLTESRLDATFRDGVLALTLEGLGPAGEVSVTARGEQVGPERFRLSALRLRGLDLDVRLDHPAMLTIGSKRLKIEGLELVGPGRLALSADVPRAITSGARISGTARWEGLRLEALGAAAGLELGGRTSGEARLTGSVARPRLTGHVRADDVRWPELPAGDADLELDVTRQTARVAGWTLLERTGLAEVDVTVRSTNGPIWSAPALRRARVEGSLRIPALDVAGAAALAGRDRAEPLGGGLEADLLLSGTVASPEVRGTVDVHGLSVGPPEALRLPPTTARLALETGADEIRLNVVSRTDGWPTVHAEAALERSLVELARSEQPGATPARVKVHVDPGPLVLPAEQVAMDRLELDFRARGPLAALRGTGRLRIEGVTIEGEPAAELATVELEGDASGWDASARLVPVGGGGVLASAQFDAAAQAWRFDVEAREANLAVLALLPAVRELRDARLDGRLTGSSSGNGPQFDGGLTASVRRVGLAGVGLFRDAVVELRAAGPTLEVPRLELAANGGHLSGAATLRRDGPWIADVSLDLERFPLPTPSEARAELTTRIELVARGAKRHVTGEVQIGAGELRFPEVEDRTLHPLELPPTVVVHRPGEDREKKPPGWVARWLAKRTARIHVRMPGGMRMLGTDTDVELATDADLRWNRERLAIEGKVRAVRGQVGVFGRRFDVERLVATFTGGPALNPALDGRLTHVQRDLRLQVGIAGTFEKPEIELDSDPPMATTELVTQLAAGDPAAPDGPGGVTGLALSGAANWASAQLENVLSEALPLDVLDVQLGPRGEARRLEAGVYVTPNLFVSLVRRLFVGPDENVNEVRAEYYLRRWLSLRTRFGDRQAGALDLVLERRFPSGRQREAARAGEVEPSAPESRR